MPAVGFPLCPSVLSRCCVLSAYLSAFALDQCSPPHEQIGQDLPARRAAERGDNGAGGEVVDRWRRQRRRRRASLLCFFSVVKGGRVAVFRLRRGEGGDVAEAYGEEEQEK